MSDEDDKIKAAAANEHNEMVRHGLMLCEKTRKQGGFADLFDPKSGLLIEDEIKRAHTAILMENAKKWLASLDESTLALTVGGYRDFIYPIIRASFPSNPINEICSVQPQTRKNGTIYWMNYIVGQTRGQFLRGQTLFDANNGWTGRQGYTDEKINGESFGTTAAAAAQTGTASETPVRAGSFELSVVDSGVTYIVKDDGNGGLVIADNGGGVKTLTGTNTINYVSGAFTVTFSAALAGGEAISADYEVATESQYVRSQIDIEMQSSGITAIRRAISMRVSMESMQDFQAEFGQDLSQTIITGAAQAILADVGGEVVRDLWGMAGSAVASFSLAVPSGINRAEHFRDMSYEIETASGAIEDATQRGKATFGIVDQKALNVLATIGAAGGFTKAGDTSKGQGLVYAGDYNGLKIFRWKFLNTLSGASANGNMLLGYKGSDWWDTGYVHAPYQQFYTNGPDERADLTRRQAFAMRYGKKIINGNMYKRVALIP